MNDAVKNYAPAEVGVQLFDELIAHAESHFEAEERLMDQYEHSGNEAHKLAHQRLNVEVNYLRKKFTEGGELLVLQFLKDWLLQHILDMDKTFASYLMQRRVDESVRPNVPSP